MDRSNEIRKQLEDKIQEQSQQLLQKTQELETVRQEAIALKIFNAKLLTQLQTERKQSISLSSDSNDSMTPTQPVPSTPSTQPAGSSQSNKKKKKKPTSNSVPENSVPTIPEPQPLAIDPSFQDLLINFQVENQRLSNDLQILEEETNRLQSENELYSVEASKFKKESEELAEKLGAATNQIDQLNHQIESLTTESNKWRDDATLSHASLQDARQRFENLNEEYLKCLQLKDSLTSHTQQLKELQEKTQIELDEKRRKVLQLSDEVTQMLDSQSTSNLNHIEEMDKQRKMVASLISQNTQERNEFSSQIQTLQHDLSTTTKQLQETERQRSELEVQLSTTTEERNQLEREKNTQIEKFESYQEMIMEREKVKEREWNDRVSHLENSLAATEEALLVAQSSVKSSEIKEVKTEYEKKKLQEEIIVLTRMREKAEMRSDVEIQKAQLSEKLRKEALEEAAILSEKCRKLEEELDLTQKQLKDLKKEFRAKFDLVESLQTLKYEHELQIESLTDQLSVALRTAERVSEIEPLQQSVRELRDEIVVLEGIKLERDELKQSLEELTSEMVTLSEAFQLRGKTIREQEKQMDLLQSDLSFLKMDDSEKRNHTMTLEGMLSEKESILVKKDRELSELRNLYSDAVAKLELLRTADEKFKSLSKSYKESTQAYDELERRYQEALATMEELSQTAAEEIEEKNIEIAALTENLAARKEVATEYEKLSFAYETLVHQYSDLMDERSQLFTQYNETRTEMEAIRTGLME